MMTFIILLQVMFLSGSSGIGGVVAMDTKQTMSPATHPLLKLGPQSQVCSACNMVMKRFKSIVARKLKGKWNDDKKTKHFKDNLPKVCDMAAFPPRLAVVQKPDQGVDTQYAEAACTWTPDGAAFLKEQGHDKIFPGAEAGSEVIDFHYDIMGSAGMVETMTEHEFVDCSEKAPWRERGGKVVLKEVGEKVGKDLFAACKHVLEVQHSKTLLERFLVKSRPDGKDIDFVGFLCGKKKLGACDLEEEVDDEDAESGEL